MPLAQKESDSFPEELFSCWEIPGEVDVFFCFRLKKRKRNL